MLRGGKNACLIVRDNKYGEVLDIKKNHLHICSGSHEGILKQSAQSNRNMRSQKQERLLESDELKENPIEWRSIVTSMATDMTIKYRHLMETIEKGKSADRFMGCSEPGLSE